MQKRDAVELADKIMAERPGVSVRVEHEGEYAPDSFAVQIVEGIVPETVTLTSEAAWQRYKAGTPDRGDDYQGMEDDMDQATRPNPDTAPPLGPGGV